MEAGFFGFAVLTSIAGLVLIVFPFVISILVGSFEWTDYFVGFAGLLFGAGFWVLSRLARSLESSPAGDASHRS